MSTLWKRNKGALIHKLVYKWGISFVALNGNNTSIDYGVDFLYTNNRWVVKINTIIPMDLLEEMIEEVKSTEGFEARETEC